MMQTAARIKLAVEMGCDLDTILDNGETALLVSTRVGCDDITKALVTNGANVNIADNFGKTPLMWCIEHKNIGMAHMLIQHNADMHRDMGGTTALTIACEVGDDDLVRMLLRHGVDANNVNCFGESAMDVAIKKNHLQLISTLAAHGTTSKKPRCNTRQMMLPRVRSKSVCGILPQISDHSYKTCCTQFPQRSVSQMEGRYAVLPKISE